MTGGIPGTGIAVDPVDRLIEGRTKAAVNAKELRETAQAFESIFMNMMLQGMRSTVRESELLGTGRGGKIFTGLLDQSLSESGSKAGRGLGIAEMIIRRYEGQAGAAEEPRGRILDVVAGEGA